MGNIFEEAIKWGKKAINWTGTALKGALKLGKEALRRVVSEKLAEILGNALNIVIEWLLDWFSGS